MRIMYVTTRTMYANGRCPVFACPEVHVKFVLTCRIGMSGETAPRFIIPSVAHLQQENKVMNIKGCSSA